MKQLSLNPCSTARRRQAGAVGAFTLTELLVVIGVVAMLSAVLLSAAFTTKERVSRAQCVNNLRQIGVGLSLYAAEANGYAPICGWPQGMNPWQTYEACRVDPANGTNITRGFYNLGLLFRTKAITDAKTFYCPSISNITNSYVFYTTAPTGWPSTPLEGLFGPYFDIVQTGYYYYPQLRVLERVVTGYGIYYLPKLTFSRVQLEFGSPISLMTAAKLTELDPQKSVVTDRSHKLADISHRVQGITSGLNALFPDGRVVFQNARTDRRTGISSPWHSQFWREEGLDGDPEAFRIIMSKWRP
jgi:type II secretory pathway pseudopilin PulG